MAALTTIGNADLLLCDAIVAEVLAGTRSKVEYASTKRELFGQFHVLPFTMEVSSAFRKILENISLGRDVHFADQLIAATAIAHNVPILTLNRKHFTGIEGLQLA